MGVEDLGRVVFDAPRVCRIWYGVTIIKMVAFKLISALTLLPINSFAMASQIEYSALPEDHVFKPRTASAWLLGKLQSIIKTTATF